MHAELCTDCKPLSRGHLAGPDHSRRGGRRGASEQQRAAGGDGTWGPPADDAWLRPRAPGGRAAGLR